MQSRVKYETTCHYTHAGKMYELIKHRILASKIVKAVLPQITLLAALVLLNCIFCHKQKTLIKRMSEKCHNNGFTNTLGYASFCGTWKGWKTEGDLWLVRFN